MGADHSTASFRRLADLASARVGGRAIADQRRLLRAEGEPGQARAGDLHPRQVHARGKWMDGWESRRRRTPGHDWCVVAARHARRRARRQRRHAASSPATSRRTARSTRSTRPGALTTASVGDGRRRARGRRCCRSRRSRATADNLLRDRRSRGRGRTCGSTSFPTAASRGCACTARSASTGARSRARGARVDLASILNGGLVLGASDMHFGAKDNMIMPGRAKNMGDGWETRRRRGPGYDWAIVRLGAPARSAQRRDRHQSLQGQLSRQRVARGAASRRARRSTS